MIYTKMSDFLANKRMVENQEVSEDIKEVEDTKLSHDNEEHSFLSDEDDDDDENDEKTVYQKMVDLLISSGISVKNIDSLTSTLEDTVSAFLENEEEEFDDDDNEEDSEEESSEEKDSDDDDSLELSDEEKSIEEEEIED